jgi:2'-5' RNA ligase
MPLRLFAALSLPDDLIRRIALFPYENPRLAWRPPETLHITLAFYGEVQHDVARDLDAALEAPGFSPFEARLQGAGSFGGREPSALWLGLARCEAIEALARHCARAARSAGLTPERAPFRPHLTLAYGRGARDTDAADFITRFAAFASEPFWVDRFALYSSWRTRAGSRYREEAVYPLGA